MGKVNGIGGIFFKCEDPEKLKSWYADHLGLETNEYGATFEFRKLDEPDKKGVLQWSPFPKDSKYMEPGQKDFMINYRVENLEEMITDMRKAGVEIVGEIAEYSYGKFAHVMDPEGHKIELWEPIDEPLLKQDEDGGAS